MKHLFTQPLPAEVQTVLDQFADRGNNYHNCKRLQTKLEEIGYTCTYGLEAEPYNLKKI